MIIGESPGKDELKHGIPFVGMSWKILKQTLETVGADVSLIKEEPYVTNALHCWPHNNKAEAVMNTACHQCQPALIEEINAHPRKLVLTLGTPALRSVTNNFSLKITQERGKYITPILDPRIKGVEHAVATIHPAYILRGGGNYRQFRGDIRYALELYHGGSPKRVPEVDYLVIDTPELLTKLYRHLCDKQALKDWLNEEGKLDIGADIETGSDASDPEGPGGLNHIDDAVLCLGLGYRDDAVYVIAEELIQHPILNKIFGISHLNWGWHNGKFDIKFLRAWGNHNARVDDDTMLMSYALDERGGVHGLEIVAHDWLSAPNWKSILDKHKKKKQSYRVIPKDILYKYLGYDVSSTLRLMKRLRAMVYQDAHSKKIYTQTFIPASEYLARIEDRGLLVDFCKVRENEEKLNQQAFELAEPIYEAALQFPESGYNEKLPNSPGQLQKLLYDDLKIPTKDRGTGADVLEKLPPHPVVVALRKYRKVAKLNGTYVKPLYEGVSSDKRVHTTFKLHGTATGRLASSDPMNLQNIPRDADIRGQFIPTPGYIFIEPDLSQAELRSLAEFSGDPLLVKIYNDPTQPGVHDTMRARLYGNPEDWSPRDVEHFIAKFFIRETDPDKIIKAILEEQKMRAKNVNFGIIYGITKFGLAEQMECSYEEAQHALDVWAQTFPVAWNFITQCRMAPMRGQNLVTVFGNRKRHGVVAFENLQALQNEAANFIHQSTASHIMLHAGIRNYERLERQWGAYVVNTVHDSMLIECPAHYRTIVEVTEHITRELVQIPRDWGLHRVPFEADAKMGPRWGRAAMIGYDKFKKGYGDAQHAYDTGGEAGLTQYCNENGEKLPFKVDYDRGHKRIRSAS
jgi:uracil-DNA glycosylase family 4